MSKPDKSNSHAVVIKVTHVLPDGTEVNSIKGMFIQFQPETKTIYELVAKYVPAR